jgi:hypothetical protein
MKLETGKFWFSIIFCSFNPIAPSIAQIVPDATLPVNSAVTVSGKTTSIGVEPQPEATYFTVSENFRF